MSDLFTTPAAGKKVARAKALLRRDETLRGLESLLEGLAEFDPQHTPAKARYEVEGSIRECVAELNRQPSIRALFEELVHSRNAAIPYASGHEEKLKLVLGILHKALHEVSVNEQSREEESLTRRKAALEEKGIAALKAGDTARGKASLHLLSEEFGKEPGMKLHIAKLLLEYEIYPEAASLLERVIEETPKDPEPYGLATQCYRDMREMEKAEAVYVKVLQRFGKHPRTLLNLAKFYVEWNKRDKAFDAANDAWKMDNSLTEAREIVDRFS